MKAEDKCFSIDGKNILEFKDLYNKIFNEELSDEKAFEISTKLINLMKLIMRNNVDHLLVDEIEKAA